MKFCDEKIQKHLLNGGKVKRPFFSSPLYYNDSSVVFKYNDKEKIYCLNKIDLLAYDWEIAEPEYDWDKIIKDKILCQFWNELKEVDPPIIGYLTKKTAEGFCGKGWYCSWEHCKPFNPADFNIAKNIKDYEK